MKFEGKCAVVTGASRGIGKEIALEFGRRGAAVACVATTVEGAATTADEIKSQGGSAQPFACDVSLAEQVETLFKDVVESLGSPAILVNNAGITKDTLVLRMSEEDWDRVQDVNLKGAFLKFERLRS